MARRGRRRPGIEGCGWGWGGGFVWVGDGSGDRRTEGEGLDAGFGGEAGVGSGDNGLAFGGGASVHAAVVGVGAAFHAAVVGVRNAFHAAVHGFVGEAVGVLVFVAEGVGDLEAVELGDAVFGLLPERFEVGGVDFVFALDLLDHEFGVGDDAEGAVAVVEGVLEGGEEAGVLGEVVGADAEKFGDLGEDLTVVVGDLGSEACGAGVSAGSAVAVGGDGGGFAEEAGSDRGHGSSLNGGRWSWGILRSFAALRMTLPKRYCLSAGSFSATLTFFPGLGLSGEIDFPHSGVRTR